MLASIDVLGLPEYNPPFAHTPHRPKLLARLWYHHNSVTIFAPKDMKKINVPPKRFGGFYYRLRRLPCSKRPVTYLTAPPTTAIEAVFARSVQSKLFPTEQTVPPSVPNCTLLSGFIVSLLSFRFWFITIILYHLFDNAQAYRDVF